MAEAKHHSRCYQCIKKTGYLVKSPTSGKMGRWRKRWIMLVDSLVATPSNRCERYPRMEYYDVPENKKMCARGDKMRNLSVMRLKGVIDLRYCIAVQPSGEKSKKFFFDVITGSSPPQGFAAESQQEREDWITALNDFLFSKRARSSSLQSSLARTPSTYSNTSSDYTGTYDHIHGYRALDDAYDFVRGKDSSQKARKTSRESLRKYLSADDISYKASSDCVQHIESPAQDVSSLQQQLALRYVPEIASDNIRNSELIGSGNFSMVSKGVWTTPSGLCGVALKHASGRDSTLRLLQEAVVTVQLWHPNVVNLLGILQQAKPTTLVTELCKQGSLLLQLKAFRSQAVPFDSNLVSTLMKYCEHILLGLNYLTEKGFVHRYLMAKHVLVSEDNVCKISGFACSELLSNEKEFTLQNDACLPVKWTAPEASMYWKFTPSSMVWSFGVMLYEIWSLGQEPYKLMANSQVIDWLLKGYRLAPPPGCFRSIYEIMVACWHPDAELRPEPSTILKYLLQLDSRSLSLANDVPKSALELGGDVSGGESLYADLQESYRLYVNSIPDKSASSYVNAKRKSSTISSQVNFNSRWSFSEEDEESEKEDDTDDYACKHIYANDSDDDYVQASPVGELNSGRLASLRTAVATNIHGRWSLSTRGSQHSFDESDDWSDVGLSMRQLTTRGGPRMTLPLFGNPLSIDSTVSVDRFEELTPRQIESDGVRSNLNGKSLFSYSGMVASHRWSVYDKDEDGSDGEKVDDCSRVSSMMDCRCHNGQVQLQGVKNRSNHSWSPTVDTPPSEAKLNKTEHMDLSSTTTVSSPKTPRPEQMDLSSTTVSSPKTPRPKPPIKPRKKLPQSSNARPETPSSPQSENTISSSASSPSIHTPKAAPRKHLLRAVSVHSYEQIQPYQCVADLDQQYLDRILWSHQNGERVPVTYYNVPSTFTCSEVAPRDSMDENTYEQIQRYEKIQTYETIPYHVELDFRNT